MPCRSHRVISGTPAVRRKRATLMPAPPAPVIAALIPSIFLPVIFNALRSAARTIEHEPCMSLNRYGTGSSPTLVPRRTSSNSSDRGDAISSMANPPNVGASMRIMRASFAVLRSLVQIGKASMPARVLKRTAFPSITGRAARGPTSPYDRTDDPSVTMATALARMV